MVRQRRCRSIRRDQRGRRVAYSEVAAWGDTASGCARAQLSRFAECLCYLNDPRLISRFELIPDRPDAVGQVRISYNEVRRLAALLSIPQSGRATEKPCSHWKARKTGQSPCAVGFCVDPCRENVGRTVARCVGQSAGFAGRKRCAATCGFGRPATEVEGVQNYMSRHIHLRIRARFPGPASHGVVLCSLRQGGLSDRLTKQPPRVSSSPAS